MGMPSAPPMNDESQNSSSSDDKSWAYKASGPKENKKDEEKPPLINLDEINKKRTKEYASRKEEVIDKFSEANWWFGVKMELEDFRKFIWSHKKERRENDISILQADKNDKQRKQAIKLKVEKNLWINSDQLEIIDYYITTNGGPIAWVKTDPRMVTLIHQRAAKAALKDLRTVTFIPAIARDRKGSIDKMLIDYKRENSDFHYIVRNGEDDLIVMIKRVSEGNFLPYRKLSLNVLGALSPIKARTKANHVEEAELKDVSEEVEDEGFQKQKSSNCRPNYIPREQIYRNITSILNGFTAEQEQRRKKQ